MSNNVSPANVSRDTTSDIRLCNHTGDHGTSNHSNRVDFNHLSPQTSSPPQYLLYKPPRTQCFLAISPAFPNVLRQFARLLSAALTVLRPSLRGSSTTNSTASVLLSSTMLLLPAVCCLEEAPGENYHQSGMGCILPIKR